MDPHKALISFFPARMIPLQPKAQVRLTMLREAEVSAKEWDRLVASLSGNFLQGYGWSRFMAGNKAKPYYAVIEADGRPVAATWLFLAASKAGPLNIAKRMHLETLPCFDPLGISVAGVFQELQALAEREGCVEISFGNSPTHHLPAGIPCRLRKKINFAIDLRPDPAALQASLHQKHRSHIRKAARAGIRVLIHDSSGDATALADTLDDMFRHSLARHLSAGKARDLREETPMRGLIGEMVKTGHAKLFVAFRDNVPLSCYAAATFNNGAYLLYGVSSRQGYELNASFLAVWTMIEHFQERGYRSMDLGSVGRSAEQDADPDHGLYRFKSGFGGNATELCSGTITLRPLAAALLAGFTRMKAVARNTAFRLSGPGERERA